MEAVQTTPTQKVRYDWVDALKFLGISSIYVGHMGEAAGALYPFTFQYCVALFFLASGFFAPTHRTAGLLAVSQEEVLRHRIAVLCVQRHQRGGECAHLGLLVYRICRPDGCGVHGRTDENGCCRPVVPSVPVCDFDWALPAEETPAVGNGWLFWWASAFMWRQRSAFPYRPVGEPRMFFGIDSAMCYILYYALGAALFPYLKDFHFRSLKPWAKALFWAVTLACAFVACVVYFKGPSFPIDAAAVRTAKGYQRVLFRWLGAIACLPEFYRGKTARACTRHLPEIGRNTLILCGTENIMKEILAALVSLTGLKLEISSHFAAFVYAFFHSVSFQPDGNPADPGSFQNPFRDTPVPGNPDGLNVLLPGHTEQEDIFYFMERRSGYGADL